MKKHCILLHLYYQELWPEYWSYFKDLKDETTDIFVTVNKTDTEWYEDIKSKVNDVFVVENKGVDFGGFLFALDKIRDTDYVTVTKLHGKKCEYMGNGYGDIWRRELYMPLIKSRQRYHEIREHFEKDPKIYLASCLDWLTHQPIGCLPETVQNHKRFNLPTVVSASRWFFGGTMFMASKKYLDLYFKGEEMNIYNDMEYGHTLVKWHQGWHVGLSMAHTLEEAICWNVTELGGKTIAIREDTPNGVKHFFIKHLQKLKNIYIYIPKDIKKTKEAEKTKEIEQPLKISQYKDSCILLHLYYQDLWPEFWEYLKNLKNHSDIFVTLNTADTEWYEDIKSKVNDVFIVENKGSDFGGFLYALHKIKNIPYKIVTKLHSKKSLRLEDSHKGFGERWRKSLYMPLIETEKKYCHILSMFDEDDCLAMAAAKSCFNDEIIYSQEIINWWKLNWVFSTLGTNEIPVKYFHISGSMYVLSREYLNLLFNGKEIEIYDKMDTQYADQGTVAHALEQIICWDIPRFKQKLKLLK